MDLSTFTSFNVPFHEVGVVPEVLISKWGRNALHCVSLLRTLPPSLGCLAIIKVTLRVRSTLTASSHYTILYRRGSPQLSVSSMLG